MYDTILFDLDGTVTNSKEGITKSVQYALKSFGIDEPDLDKLECFIGPPLAESFLKYYPLTKEEVPKALEKYRERYKPVGCYENTLYEGIGDLLASLKDAGYTVCLATSKPEFFAVEILKQHNIINFFDVVAGSEMDGTRSDKAEVIKEVFKRLNFDEARQKNAVMVGDREHDIHGAHTAGIDSIGIRYGFSVPGELEQAGATHIFDTVAELKNFLLEQI